MFTLGHHVLMPFTRYVMHTLLGGQVRDYCGANGIGYRESNFNSYERRYAGQNSNGRRIAMMRSSAIGDTLMSTAVAHYILHQYPETRIDVYCSPVVQSLWGGTGVVIYPHALTLDAAQRYDWHIFYEWMLESNSEPDQRNCYDDAFAFVGIDPATVPDEFKRPFVVEHPHDSDELKESRLTGGTHGPDGFEMKLPESYFIYQLSAANPNRSYPVELAAEACDRICRATGMDCIIVGTTKNQEIEPKEMTRFQPLIESGRALSLVNRTKNFRTMIPLIKKSKLVVCVDSSIGHLAAAFPEVPVISLWGLFHPDDRVKYYSNHHPIFPKETCPHAPCHNHEFTLPQVQCKDAVNAIPGEQRACNVLRAITPARIEKLATALMEKKA